MKIIHLPFGENTYAIFGLLFFGVQLLTFISAAIAFSYGIWDAFFIHLSIFLLLGIYDLLILTNKIFPVINDKYSIQFITKIDEDGFINRHHEYNVEVRYDWKAIKYCKLDTDKNLLIRRTSGIRRFIKIGSERDFELLNRIPKSKLLDNQIPDFVRQVCSEVTNCKVCGKISVWNAACLSCASDVYNVEIHDEFEDEIEYLKYEQIECFKTYDKDEKVDFFEENSTFFERNLDWQPLVTKAEVIAYSKELNWD